MSAKPAAQLLIIGYGNPLRSDDGIGPRVAGLLGDESSGDQVRVIAAHQLLPEMAEPISQARRVIFIDASALPPPGKIITRSLHPLSTAGEGLIHDFSPQMILAYALNLYGQAPQAVLVTVNGFSFDHGETLSPQLEEMVPRILRQIRQVIMEWAL